MLTFKTRSFAGLALAGLLFAPACGDKEGTGSAVPENTPPVAEAGSNQVLTADVAINLDGSGSSDADGDALSYSWSFLSVPEGSALAESTTAFSANESSAAVTTTFNADAVGTFVVQLIVSDGVDNSSADIVTITTQDPADIPVADAGADQTVSLGTTVSVNGERSFDSQGRTLTYAWSFVSVDEQSALTDADLTGSTSAEASFTPDTDGVFLVNLTVNNGLASSLADAVMITVLGDGGPPVANPGEAVVAEDCTYIQLDGSASADPDGDALTFYWELQSKPANSAATNDNFSDRTAANPTFWTDQAGAYVLSLAVHDGESWSRPGVLTIDAAERTYNTEPVVTITEWPLVAGGDAECEASGYTYNCEECDDQVLQYGTNVTIVDAENDPYTVLWEVVNGDIDISSPDQLVSEMTFEDVEATELGVCDSNEYELQLTIQDCPGATVVQTTVVTVECCGVEAVDSGSGAN